MNKIRTLTLALLIIVSPGFVLGSFGFTSVSAERGVSVQVVNDDRAYVGYQSSDLTVRDGETVDLVEVKNRFTNTIDIGDITIEDGNFRISNLNPPTNIPPGERRDIRGTVECTPNETQKIGLTVTLKGSGVTAQIFGDTETREFTLRCAPETEESP